MTLLREDLLQGRVIAVAGGVRPAVCEALAAAGARLETFDSALDEHRLDDHRADQWARARSPFHALVYDAAPTFTSGGHEGLQAAIDQAWVAIRAVATGALIPGSQGGKVVLLAPCTDAGEYSEAARSALENIARTLSIEWARYAITTTAIAASAAVSEHDLATFVTFLLCPAGDYFSGCRFDLGSVGHGPGRGGQ